MNIPANLFRIVEVLISKGLITESIENDERVYRPTSIGQPMMDLALEAIYSCQQCFLTAVADMQNKNRTDIAIIIYPIEKNPQRFCLGCFSRGQITVAEGIVKLRKL